MAKVFDIRNGNSWAYKQGFILGSRQNSEGIYGAVEGTFARTSVANRTNKDGVLEEVGVGVPLIDFADNAFGALRLEPSTTNWITYSEDLTNAAWSKMGVSASIAQGIAPDGENTMNRITEDTSSGLHRVREDFSSATGERTASFYFDSANRSYLAFSFLYNVNSRGVGLIIDLSDNSEFDSLVSGTVTYSYKITDLPNSTIKRVEITAENTVENIMNSLQISSFDGGSYSFDAASRTPDYTGDGSNSLLCWGFQAETLSYASSYVKTEGSAVTRNASSLTGFGNEFVLPSVEGVIFARISLKNALSSGLYFSISDGTANNRVLIGKNSASANIITAITVATNPEYGLDSASYQYADDTYVEIALKWSAGDFATLINGVEVDSQLSGSSFGANTLNVLTFDSGGGSAKFFGDLEQLQVYDQASDINLINWS